MLQVHKGVAEELSKGDPGIWTPLKQPQQKVSTVLGHLGPWRELMYKHHLSVTLNAQHNSGEPDISWIPDGPSEDGFKP